jgi:ribosomal protein S9
MKKIFIYIFLVTIVSNIASAKVIHINYEAKFGILGRVGKIDNKIIINGGKYTIDTTLKLYGIAKMLLGNQKEHYISKGRFVSGKFIPNYYSMSTIKSDKKSLKEYFFDHKRKSLTRVKKKWRDGKITTNDKRVMSYATDDLLTLYFNMNRHIQEHKNQHNFTLNVAGLERQKGKVTISVATKRDIKKYRDDLGSSASWYAKAHIVQKSFKNKSGDILLSVSKDGYIKKAVIKDLVMYGDAVLYRK